ncbi:heat shock factor protein isoform X2 [Aphidius gifuensis]|uniref:heat shock factor protein isoform X2 n=1 Tax=Aphidius gifuensis TaxID=684658 RepID=UPI001CDD508F|nr:heat shock factor protein isoform X2 [Aphidius gifuensis]
MRTVTEIETNVPAFLGKLWKLVEDPETDDLICWSINGRSFFIRNPSQFARDLLPHYYKHNNMASFVRQLNMYGFHKKVSVELGGLKCDRDEMEFAHQYFIKDHPYLLEHIKRKIASSKIQDSHPPIKTEAMNKVLAEVRTMRGKQENLDSKLVHMKQQNESLWREISLLRRKHAKQQEIVNKLIHFLVTLVQPNRNGGLSVKRRYPLMIDSHQRHKQSKTPKSGTSPTGPVIHELHETEHNPDLDSEYIVAEILENHYPSVQSPKSIDGLLDNEIQESEQLFEQSLAADNDDDDEYLQTSLMSPKRKHPLKPKKKRKHKMPVKITIPPADNGGDLREETLMVEMNLEDEEMEEAVDTKNIPVIPPKTKAKRSVLMKPKPVPVKTVRSSKLAAMAANINKMTEQNDSDEDDDYDHVHDELITDDINDDINDDGDVNLDNILTIPNLENPDNVGASGSFIDGQQIVENSPGSSDNTQDLSLSCINTLSGNNTTREEIDSHINEVQANFDMIRDQCMRGELQGVDASVFLDMLQLSSNGDLMSDFPMNPDFDLMPHEDNYSEEQTNAGGELMAYNPSSSLLDFSDGMFTNEIDNTSPVGTTSSLTECYNPDPLDLEDSKALLVESLLSDANANKSGNS